MSKQSNTMLFALINAVNKAHLSPYCEAVSFESPDTGTKNFTPADLWNIQRRGKIRVQRRFL